MAAGGSAESLTIVITGTSTEAVAAIERVNTALGQTAVASKAATSSSAAMSARFKSQGAAIASAGKSMTKGLTLPIVAVGGAAIKMSVDFHKSMTLVQTQAGASEKEVRRMSKAILDFAASGKTDQGPKQLADGLYAIESAGIHGSKALRTLKASADLAMIGQSDLASTTKALVAAQKTGIKGSANLKREIGTLNATVGSGQMHMQDLMAAMGTGFLTSAKAVGLNLSDVGAALAELTKQGIPASAAATRLRMTFSLMAAPTTKAKAALAGIGLGAADLARTMRSQGLVPALELLHKHLTNLSKIQQTQVLSEAFGGARSGTTIMALLGNLGDLDKTLGNIHKHSGEVNKSLAAARATSAEELKIAWAQVQAAMVRLGDVLGPVVLPQIGKLANAVSDVAGWFSKLPGSIQSVAVTAALLLAAMGPLTLIFGKGISAIGTMIGLGGKLVGTFSAEAAGAGELTVALNDAAVAQERLIIANRSGATVGSMTVARSGAAAAGTSMGGVMLGGAGATLEKGAPGLGSRLKTGLAKAAPLLKGVGYTAIGLALMDGVGHALEQQGSTATKIKAGIENIPVLGGVYSDIASQFGVKSVKATEDFNAQLALLGIHGKALKGNFQALNTELLQTIPAMVKSGQISEDDGKALSAAANSARDYAGTLNGLRSGLEKLPQVVHNVHAELRAVSQDPTLTGKEIRARQVQLVSASITGIRAAIQAGYIGAKEGNAKIRQLAKEGQLYAGEFARHFGATWGRGLIDGRNITQRESKNIIGELAKMPPKAREKATDMMLGFLNGVKNKSPQLKAQIAALRNAIADQFGQTAKQSKNRFENILSGVGGVLGRLGGVVNRGISAIVDNLNKALKALHVHGAAVALSDVGAAIGNVAGNVAGAAVPGQAKGGLQRVRGHGVQDTVPLAIGGAIRAKVAPGEDLAVFNRHQRPLVDAAVAEKYGVAGLPGFFRAFTRAHNYAGGGIVHPMITGAGAHGPLERGAQHGIDHVYHGAVAMLRKRRAAARAAAAGGPNTGAIGTGPGGVGSYEGVPMANWVIQSLLFARGKGWRGHPTSGYRPGFDPHTATGASEHQGTRYPHGAVDFGGFVDPAARAVRDAVVRATAGYKYPLLHPIGFSDDGHASGTGHSRGGLLAFAKGGFPHVNAVGKALNAMVGGNYSSDEVATLWHVIGGKKPGLFGQISQAESGGNPNIPNSQGDGGIGLVQMTGKQAYTGFYGDSSGRNPLSNLLGARDLYQGGPSGLGVQGISAWDASKDGWHSFPLGHVNRELAVRMRGAIAQFVGPDTAKKWGIPGITGGMGGAGTSAADAQAAKDAKKIRKQRRNQLALLQKQVKSAPDQKTRLFALQDLASWFNSYGIFDKDEKKKVGMLHQAVARAAATPELGDDISALRNLTRYEAKHAGVSAQPQDAIAKEQTAARRRHREKVLAALFGTLRKAQGQGPRLDALKAIAGFYDHFGVFSAKDRERMGAYKAAVKKAEGTPTLKDDLAAYKGLVAFEHLFGKVSGKDFSKKGAKGKGGAEDTGDTGTTEDTGTDTSNLEAMNTLLTEQLRITRQSLAISQSQYGVFASWLSNMAPFVGAFGGGGTVPGPLGKAYSAIVHGGEQIGPPAAPAPIFVMVSGSVAPLLDAYVTRSSAHANRAIGRSARIMATAPGG